MNLLSGMIHLFAITAGIIFTGKVRRNRGDSGMICPLCGDEMNHRNQGIYECQDCDVMIPDDDDEDLD